jgi:hypothetical protein
LVEDVYARSIGEVRLDVVRIYDAADVWGADDIEPCLGDGARGEVAGLE